MICEKCGKLLPDTASVCDHCGTGVPQHATQNSLDSNAYATTYEELDSQTSAPVYSDDSAIFKVLGSFVTFLVLLFTLVGVRVLHNVPHFEDVTVELGSVERLDIWSFLVNNTQRDDIAFISDVSKIDLNTPGTTPITVRGGNRLHTVNLTVQDTTAPEVTFIKELTLGLGQTPKAADFVESVYDLSPVTIRYSTPFQTPETYSDQILEIAVTDKYGNTTRGKATVHFDWMKEHVTLELGTPLTREDILLNAEQDGELISDAQLDEISSCGIGTYVLPVTSGDSTRNCTIEVVDTTPPALELKEEVAIHPGESCDVYDFLITSEDISGAVQLEFISGVPTDIEGHHKIEILATDKNGLQTTKTSLLRVYHDLTPPEIYSLYDIYVTANSSAPDYKRNVRAYDWGEGEVKFTFDDSEVDLSCAGVYYAYYYAEDSKGNKACKPRKVIVKPDYQNTEQLIAEVASTLKDSDVRTLRDFVRENVVYLGPRWGGDDPAGYGFTYWEGNCKVHAYCLKALLDYFGYENEIIYVMPQYSPHYWNVVKLDGVWYHIDSTPSPSGRTHSKYSEPMTNEQRLETLSGRKWDTSLWPFLNEEE